MAVQRWSTLSTPRLPAKKTQVRSALQASAMRRHLGDGVAELSGHLGDTSTID